MNAETIETAKAAVEEIFHTLRPIEQGRLLDQYVTIRAFLLNVAEEVPPTYVDMEED
jgi:hypothetical protein